MTEVDAESALRQRMTAALGIQPVAGVIGAGTLTSVYPVADLAAASIATFADALTDLLGTFGRPPAAIVDRALACGWFAQALHPVGWALPSPWDAVAGDYLAADGWIRLHTNAPQHRAAALGVLGVAATRDAVTDAVRVLAADELEARVVAAGGAAATMRTPDAWAQHPQGRAVAAEPLIDLDRTEETGGQSGWMPTRQRPLAGLRVLDLTRVLAGPVATRALAAYGATVLRIDPPDWDEPAIVPDMTLGKRSARLDARTPEGRDRLHELLAGADVLVHGYREGALDHLGLDAATRRAIRPGLIDVSLTAYGHSGPWAGRRGFDSLVQMSSGIAQTAMQAADAAKPVPLPVQGLDHATGWLIAASVLRGLALRIRDDRGTTARLSLARTAVELELARPLPGVSGQPSRSESPSDIETPWGSATLLAPPLTTIPAPTWQFDRGPSPLGSALPSWP